MEQSKKPAMNPYLPLNVCIADGEPHVFGNRVYVFGSHDTPGGESFCLEDYEFFSAPLNDLSSWTSKGINYSARQDPMYGENARFLYAPNVVRGNDGRYYLYYCLAGWKGKGGYSHLISVAVCDSPDGKYEYYGVVQNPDSTPYRDFVCFDPAVMNDEGVVRLYFGAGAFRAMEVKPWNAFVLAPVYSAVYGKPVKTFRQDPSPLGANAATLCDDMLTLKEPPKRIADTPTSRVTPFLRAAAFGKSGRLTALFTPPRKTMSCAMPPQNTPTGTFAFAVRLSATETWAAKDEVSVSAAMPPARPMAA